MIRRALAVAAVLVLAPLPAMADPVDDIHTATNKARADHGLAPLTRSRCLDDTAQKWTDHRANEGRHEHSDMDRLMKDCGLTGAGENISFGYDPGEADEVVQDWMDSPDHRANILDPVFTSMGAGWSGRFATQQFGTGEATDATPTRTPTQTPAPSRGLAKTGVTTP